LSDAEKRDPDPYVRLLGTLGWAMPHNEARREALRRLGREVVWWLDVRQQLPWQGHRATWHCAAREGGPFGP